MDNRILKKYFKDKKIKLNFFLLMVIIFLYIFLSLKNFLLFHTFAELFSIIIAFNVAIIVINTFNISLNSYFTFLGIAYGFVAGFDLLHTLSYKGVGIFNNTNENLPTQLWIIARYMESLSLLFSFYFLNRKIRPKIVTIFYSSVSILLLLSTFYFNIFPKCYIPGLGLTQFKVISEYIISLILIFSIILLLKNKEKLNYNIHILLLLSIISTIISELFFTFYIDVYGISNIIGHIFKIISFYLVYKAICETALKEPYRTLFNRLNKSFSELQTKTNELKKANEKLKYNVSHDYLTGLHNRDYFQHLVDNLRFENRNSVGLIVCDIDGLKYVNDNFGHTSGDKLIISTGNILEKSVRKKDLIARIGGDEFAILMYEVNKQDIKKIIQRIRENINNYNKNSGENFKLSLSIGYAIFDNESKSFEDVFKEADKAMYRKKSKKKNTRLK
ncbi:sensor domain-containing diguanylate cyclase [Thermohalobacter berrensis]|uniref:GGDEF domain-containing protein n=1 Tax=Thermohalobacter berrensis TaxID=99594 RepID=A0A419T9P3_9FIRM|nr:GGDEF domain-containing protein [Thermohalobacter berrensis]RKD34194.1 hypothetical protein BET03_07850 [Thermohalobacter berrensis]